MTVKVSTCLLSLLGLSFCVNLEKLGKMEGNGSVGFSGRANDCLTGPSATVALRA